VLLLKGSAQKKYLNKKIMDQLWKAVLAEIEIEVSKPVFITFFKSCRLVSFSSSVATISTPAFMTAEYLEKRYYAFIKKTLDKKSGENTSLVFVSGGEKAKAKNQSHGPLFASHEQPSNKKLRPGRIRQDFTFESLAVSDSNQLAYTAALAVAQSPGTKYSPLFLYGTVGVGKTHLMHSIANKAFEDNENVAVLYMTTEEFTNEVVEAIRDKTTTQLRRKFRNVDLLLLDDIQFLSGKEKVQEELFHTFNTLLDKQRQIVFSSDRPPSEIKKIEARLASRFEGGLSVDIAPPDFELRTAILLIKSRKYGFVFSIDVAKLVAEKIVDTRALEGFLLRLATSMDGRGNQEVLPQDVLPLLGKTKPTSPFLHPDMVIDEICRFYNLKPTQLKGAKRDAFLVRARHLCMFLLKEEAQVTLSEIGNLLGGRDHTTVMHGVEKVRVLLQNSEKIKGELSVLKEKIKQVG